jgi:hypothetical protein
MRENKKVTFKNLTVGQEIKGIEDGSLCSSFNAIIKDINPAFVTYWMWGKADREEKVRSDVMFLIEMTEEDFNDKYREKAKEVLNNIQNKLNYDEIGYHEMWNSWLYGTPYEIAKECINENITIRGYSSDIGYKTDLSGEILDIGVCAEYEDGERFWCHFSTKCLNDLLSDNNDLLD